MKTEWLTTTAVLAVLGSGVAFAQAQEPQKQHEHMGPRAQQGATKQPNAQPGRQGEQRAERQRPQEPGKPAEQQAQPRDQEHKQNQAQERTQHEQKANQQAQDQDRWQERGKAMSQRPSSLTSEQRPDQNGKNAESKAQSKAESKTDSKAGSNASQRANEERGKQRNQATQNSKQPSQQNATRDKNQNNTPNRTNAQNAPARPNANQAKGNQSPSTSQAQQSPQNQPSAQGTNGTNQASQNTNQCNSASAKLSQNDRSKVISTLRSDTRGSRENVNVSLNIGERLPPRIHARPLPRTIVDIMPEYRGYDYVIVQDRVDIIDPRTHEVVDIVEESGPTMAEGGGTFVSRTFQSGRVRLSTEQRQMLFRDARSMTSSQVSSAGGICLTEQPVPDSLASQNPDLKGYNFLKVGNDIVLIDPKDNKVIDVIQQ